MAGRNFLFVPGPTNVPDRVLRAMTVPMEDHRSPIPGIDPCLFDRIEAGVQDHDRQPHPVSFLRHRVLGGGAHQLPEPGDKVLIARFGQFSHLWADMCARLGFEVEIAGDALGRRRAGRTLPGNRSMRTSSTRSKRYWSVRTRRRPA
jgi:alanine-glyoxylate transaminase/serine-glyoxylate transaminase/serine-pyruvate transaminase